MTTTVVKSIGSGVGRDFASIGAWKSSLPNLTTSDTIQVGEVYNDNGAGVAALTENALLDVAGATATNYLVLRAAAGHEFNPVGKTGAWITNSGGCLRVSTSFTRIEHLGFVSTNTSSSQFNCLRLNNPSCRLHACYVEMIGGTNAANVGFADLSSGSNTFTDCIAQGARGAGLAIGFQCQVAGDVLLNCVANDIARTVTGTLNGTGFQVGTSALASRIHNSIGAGSPVADFAIGSASTISHCVSSDATATGTGSKTGFDAAHLFVSPATRNYHLLFNAAAFNAGTDPASWWPSGLSVIDFEGTAHNADGNGFDVGAFNLNNPTVGSPAVDVFIAPPAQMLLVAGASAPAVDVFVAAPASTVVIARASAPAVQALVSAPVALLLVAGASVPAVLALAAPPVSTAVLVASPAALVFASPPLALVLVAGAGAPAVLALAAPAPRDPVLGIVIPVRVVLALELDVVHSKEIELAARVARELRLDVASSHSVTLPVRVKLEPPAAPVLVARG